MLLVSSRGIVWLANNNYLPFSKMTYKHFQTNDKVVALTYDDGPSPAFTDSILEVLNHYQVNATFFMVGKEVQKYPWYVKKISEYGHEIGNHSWSHQKLIFKTPSHIMQEIMKTDSIIKSQGYAHEIMFRAPYGKKLIVLPYVLSILHKPHILFDVLFVDEFAK